MMGMKTRVIFFAAVAAFLSVSCGRVSDVTAITGKVVNEGVTEVAVQVEGVLDTIVPVVDGQFFVEVPADIATCGVVAVSGLSGVNFIPDGTPLEIILDENSTVTSKYPRVSVQERLNAYMGDEKALMGEYNAKRQEIASDASKTSEEQAALFEAYFEEFTERYYEHHKVACKANADNFISVFALNNLRGQLDDEEFAELFEGMSPVLLESKFVKDIKVALDARLETSAGKMFKDFTVNSVVGQTMSIPPQPVYAEVKLSDYVGKGKYVLLDFWAPWCGPCKREMPNIKAVYEKYKGEDFDVVSIAVWERQPVDVTIKTAAELGMDWNQINNAGYEAAAIYGVEAIPHLILFGPDGTILKRGFHGAEIEEIVAEYLK